MFGLWGEGTPWGALVLIGGFKKIMGWGKTFFLILYLVNLVVIAQHYLLFCYQYDVFGQYQIVAYLAKDAH